MQEKQENKETRNELLANCDICGKELSRMANFCTNCGHPYRVDTPKVNIWGAIIRLFTIMTIIIGIFISITVVIPLNTWMGFASILGVLLYGVYSFSFISILDMLETIQHNTRHR